MCCVLALAGLPFTAMGLKRQGQAGAIKAAPDASCMYDPGRDEIPDCIQKAANGELSVKQHVLKQLQFNSLGLAVLWSATNGWMYVSRTGKVVIIGVAAMDNWADTFHDGLVRVVRNNKYGFSNPKGELVISAVYDGAMNFENGKAKVCKGCISKCLDRDCEHRVLAGGDWFQIDTKGTVVARVSAEN